MKKNNFYDAFYQEILHSTLSQTQCLNDIQTIIIHSKYDEYSSEKKLEEINKIINEWRWPWMNQSASGNTST